ncbi:MAG TPA: SDR family NAD(P)-dependent oxidoreductase [Gemmatimonadales bacterium]|nr:SDR family NAD(P)-dependent oxidoreductase [Gemmatimonadales bacterium]
MSQAGEHERSARNAAPLLLAAGVALLAMRRLSSNPGYSLHGRVALITGGSRGLGLELARQLAVQGARVAICGRDADSLARARTCLRENGAEVLSVPADVSDPESVAEMADTVRRHFGAIDVLVNNAGVIEVGPAVTMSLADYEEAMATNFWGMLYPTLAILPEMRNRQSGRIINITSIGGKLGIPHLLPYSASKFAAVGFSQGLRAEVASDGVKVVTVCPGLMRTGSPRNATFRGRHKAEYAWFSISDALPGLSVSAENAARRIIAACRRGDAELVFPVPARLAAVANAVAPGMMAAVLATVGRMLPGAHGQASVRRKGAESQSRLSPSLLSHLGDEAARKYNQIAPVEGANS